MGINKSCYLFLYSYKLTLKPKFLESPNRRLLYGPKFLQKIRRLRTIHAKNLKTSNNYPLIKKCQNIHFFCWFKPNYFIHFIVADPVYRNRTNLVTRGQMNLRERLFWLLFSTSHRDIRTSCAVARIKVGEI